MPDFVNIAITVDPAQITDAAIARLQANIAAVGITGYVAADANFEIIIITTLAPVAADASQLAAQLAPAVFRTFGTQLANIPYQQGASATIPTTWTLGDTVGHTITAGTQCTVAGYPFSVLADVVVAPGASTAAVTLVAGGIGVAYNNVSSTIQLVEGISWVSTITAVFASSGGVDQESDTDYQNRLVGELALQAPRPITASDYATFVLSVPSTIIPSGVVVGRSTAIDGFNPAVTTFTGTVANASATMTAVSSFTGVTAGSILTGTSIPANTTVVSVNTGASTLVMSNAATGAHTAESVTATGSYGNSRCVTTFVTDPQGNALSGTAMTDIQNWLQTYREVNFLAFVQPPSYTTIYVTYEVHALPGYAPTALIASCNTAILGYLNPATWGAAGPATESNPPWLNSVSGFNVIRYNKMINAIESVPGVDFVPPGSAGLAMGTSASPTGTTDITMVGPAPLPTSNLLTPTIIGSVV